MHGSGSKYDYDALAYQADDDAKHDAYFADTPCRAVLNAATQFASPRTAAPAAAKPSSLRSVAKGLLRR